MRIELSEGCGPVTGLFSLAVGLDDDFPGGCCGGNCSCGDTPGESEPEWPTLTVRQRERTAMDFDGVPLLDWFTVATGPAIEYVKRVETNDATGQTLVKVSAVIGWDGEHQPRETAVVWDSDGRRWEITSMNALPGRLEMQLERIEDGP